MKIERCCIVNNCKANQKYELMANQQLANSIMKIRSWRIVHLSVKHMFFDALTRSISWLMLKLKAYVGLYNDSQSSIFEACLNILCSQNIHLNGSHGIYKSDCGMKESQHFLYAAMHIIIAHFILQFQCLFYIFSTFSFHSLLV